MKRFLGLILSLSCLVLTSCKVNLGERSFDVHWLVIVIPVVIIFLLTGLALGRTKYYCPNCNRTFYASFIKCLFSTHVNDERALKCPHCKKVNKCYPSYDQDTKE